MTGWTSLRKMDEPILSIYESIWSTYLTQLGDPCNDWRSWMDRYICNTNRWLHLQYKNFALYINDTTGSPLNEINRWPCHWQNWIPRTLLSHLRHRRSALSLIQLDYPIYKTQNWINWRLDFFHNQNISIAQTDGTRYIFHKWKVKFL